MSKQDRQGVRTPAALERKYPFGQIKENQNNSNNQNIQLNQLKQDFAKYQKSVSIDIEKINQFMTDTNIKLEELEENDKMWFYSGAPTLESYPAVDWTTDELKAKHMGDMYYDVDNGNMYIFKCVDNSYSWESCFDDDDVDYDTAYNEGYTAGYEIGLEEGKQSSGGEYDQAFIDAIFSNGVTELLITSNAIVDQGCRGRTNLKKVTLTKVLTINSYGFYNCSGLETMIISATAVPTLKNVNVFTNTPIASGTGYIYVPADLVEEYKAASNWSTFADQIRAIEDYPDVLNDEGGE